MSTEMNGAMVPANQLDAAALESVLLGGDLERLKPAERVSYMLRVCETLGLNHLTKPFEFIKLNGKLVMYARRECTEQLRKLNGISVRITGRALEEGVYIVTAQATDKHGRVDESTGAVAIENLKGEARANAMMKAETKAKRRVTLSISGLGMLDETEVETVPAERPSEYSPPKAVAEATERVQRQIAELRAPKGHAADAAASLNGTGPQTPAPGVQSAGNVKDTVLKVFPGAKEMDPDHPDLIAAQLTVSKLCISPPPNGHGMKKPHAKNWLLKRFSCDTTSKLTLQQALDAETLLRARMNSEEEYHAKVDELARDGRCNLDEPGASG